MTEITIEVDLNEATRKASKTMTYIEELRTKFNLDHIEYTHQIRIAPLEIPHSHPILTLNTQFIDTGMPGKLKLLAQYVHEQIHWGLDLHRKQETQKAITFFEDHYADLHSSFPETAQDRYSTYLHVIVNWLELDYLRRLLGEPTGDEIVLKSYTYSKIYTLVHNDFEFIQSQLEKFGIYPLPSATEKLS